jgi:hypothetical protein
VDVDADVVAVREERIAGVDPHPNTNRRLLEPTLSLPGARDGVGSLLEDDEEAVTVRADLKPAVAPDRVSDDSPVLLEGVGVAVAELL